MTAHPATPHPATPHPVQRHAADSIIDAVDYVRPRLRGWLHAAVAPAVLIVGLLLVGAADTGAAKIATAVFTGSSLLLFAGSAIYNLHPWAGGLGVWLQRFDHANIYLLIAGSYTPFATVLLDGTAEMVMLVSAWTGALVGTVFRLGFPTAPRWAATGSYLALGWIAIAFAPTIASAAGPAVTTLLLTGGILYTVGAVVYARQRPDPWPRWFGFHEIFHAFTVVAFATHCAGLALLHA